MWKPQHSTKIYNTQWTLGTFRLLLYIKVDQYSTMSLNVFAVSKLKHKHSDSYGVNAYNIDS